MTTDWRALCAELVKELDDLRESSEGVAGLHRNGDLAPWSELGESGEFPWLSSFDRARAALAEPDGPAVPEGREPASVAMQPSDRELLELMPETMRDEFAYAAKVCSEATGGQVKPRIFRVCLNTAALEYARAVLARFGGQR